MSLHDAESMIELACNHLHLTSVIVEMLLLAGHFEVAAPGEVAVNGFFADNLLDAIDGLKGCGVHAAREIAFVHGDELVHAQFHTSQHHSAVAGAGTPADGFRFRAGDWGPAFCESAGGGKAGKACANYPDVRPAG